jgi:3-deoxy-manno-octulosonate cytidylyltransferase (CMP-KDO synthetase)
MIDSNFRVVIPARYASTRFPGKALAELHGRSIVQHVYDCSKKSGAKEIIIATDDERIAEVCRSFGADVAMTRVYHESGTDRVAEVARLRGWSDDTIVVNVQGDAPLIPSESIDQVAGLLAEHGSAEVATLCSAITDQSQFQDAHVVKVVFDHDGRAMYFSRAGIPAIAHGMVESGDDYGMWRHIGLYAYRVGALARLAQMAPCELEKREKLEQLRALWHGMEIRVGIAATEHGPDVDTPDDLVAVERLLLREGD